MRGSEPLPLDTFLLVFASWNKTIAIEMLQNNTVYRVRQAISDILNTEK